MSRSIETYLDALKKELSGSDRAIKQDAVADAEEHLTTALREKQADAPEMSEESILTGVIQKYGTPAETAAAYREIETRTAPRPVSAKQDDDSKNFFAQLFSIYSDPLAWGGLVYMLISLILGTLYFSWTVTTVTLALTLVLLLSLLLRGFAAFSIFSIRGLALLEGRIIEGLLGIRMPRRRLFERDDLTWKERVKKQLASPETWKMLGYMILMLPLGVLYFTLAVTLIALSLAGFAVPFFQEFTNFPIVVMGGSTYYLEPWMYPLCFLAGFVILTLTMYAAKGIGQLHGKFAKFMLVP